MANPTSELSEKLSRQKALEDPPRQHLKSRAYFGFQRMSLFFYLTLSLGQGPRLAHMSNLWAQSWWANRHSIMVFTLVNSAITAGTEYVSRDLIGTAATNTPEKKFLIKDSNGPRINRQSMTNILMTCFASLLGGPVYFFNQALSRWMFFMAFGVFNSALAQSLISLFATHPIRLDPFRILFDLIYCGTLKFGMFEIGRRTILKLRHGNSVLRVGTVRLSQDLTMTYIKVALLNILHFKG